MFFRPDLSEYNKHSIYSDWWLILDYVPLTISIAVTEKYIQTRIKNSKEEENFVTELIEAIKRLNTENIPSRKVLKQIIQTFTNDMGRI